MIASPRMSASPRLMPFPLLMMPRSVSSGLPLKWFPDGQLYVNLRGYDPGQPVPATDALAGFLRSLGMPGQDIPPEQDQRAARYRSLLADKRTLVVLDNAGSAEQVRPLLPGTPACTVLVT